MAKTTDVIALHFGSDGIEIVRDTERANKLYNRKEDKIQFWGADKGDRSVLVTGFDDADYQVKFHPGRDYQWGAGSAQARMEWALLQAKGVPLKTDLFRGNDGFDDLDLLWSMCDGQHSGMKAKGYDAAWLLDAAPSVYIAEETIRQTGEIVTEDKVQLSARTFLPSVTYNTFLQSYRYDRIAELMNGIAMPVGMGSATERAVKQSGDYDRAPVYKPLHFFESGATWEWFELERHAETKANGAPDIDIVNLRLRMAREAQEHTYNNVALFGWPAMKLTGLLDCPELATYSTDAAQELGANSDPVEDLAIFVNVVKDIINTSITIEKPDTIALGTGAWLYINTTDYKSVDAGMNETLAAAIMRHIGPLGIKDLVWIPEMDYRAEQKAAWISMGFSDDLSERWAGGIDTENVMVVFRKSPETGRMVIGKDVAARPQNTVEDRTTVRYVQSLGSFDARKPAAFRIIKDIGPAAA